MKKNKHIICVILSALMLMWGAPYFDSEFGGLDGKAELEDAIAYIRDFAQSTSNTSLFKQNIQKVVSSLSIVAGLKTVIKEDTGKGLSNGPNFSNYPFLLCVIILSLFCFYVSGINEDVFIFRNADIPPDPLPP